MTWRINWTHSFNWNGNETNDFAQYFKAKLELKFLGAFFDVFIFCIQICNFYTRNSKVIYETQESTQISTVHIFHKKFSLLLSGFFIPNSEESIFRLLPLNRFDCCVWNLTCWFFLMRLIWVTRLYIAHRNFHPSITNGAF